MRQIKVQPPAAWQVEGMEDVASLLSRRVPRYTSYPTAPQFHAGIDADMYASWLGQLPEAEDLSLYFHIPFCDSLCYFCGCHTSVVNRYKPVHDYLEFLLQEVSHVAALLGSRRRVRHIHWGGGSPTMLSPADIAALDDATRNLFDVVPDAEFAVEIDPRGLKEETVRALAAAGLTRASIGVQDCNPVVQKAINRVQPDEVVEDAVRMLRAAGVRSLNFDLIYGLPYQEAKGLVKNLSLVLNLAPDRLAVFGYAHVPEFKKHQALIPASVLPGPVERMGQEKFIHSVLLANNYQSIGLDHYARAEDELAHAAQQGSLARNFQGYTTDAAPVLIGFGASAIGSLPQGYVQNAVSIADWRTKMEAGTLATVKGIALSPDDRVRGHVIARLMCDLTVNLNDVAQQFGLPAGYLSEALESLDELHEAGLVTVAGGIVRVNPRYRQAVRLACASFDAYARRAATRHAVTA